MALDQSELDAFQQFIAGQNLDAENLEDALLSFRHHQVEVAKLREHVAPAVDESRRGEAQALSAETLKREVRERLVRRGIVD